MKFKARFHLHCIPVQGKAGRADPEAAASASGDEAKAANEGGCTKQQVFNAENCKGRPPSTITAGEKSVPGIKSSMDRLIFPLVANEANIHLTL